MCSVLSFLLSQGGGATAATGLPLQGIMGQNPRSSTSLSPAPLPIKDMVGKDWTLLPTLPCVTPSGKLSDFYCSQDDVDLSSLPEDVDCSAIQSGSAGATETPRGGAGVPGEVSYI